MLRAFIDKSIKGMTLSICEISENILILVALRGCVLYICNRQKPRIYALGRIKKQEYNE
jgi:hypothetical protein